MAAIPRPPLEGGGEVLDPDALSIDILRPGRSIKKVPLPLVVNGTGSDRFALTEPEGDE